MKSWFIHDFDIVAHMGVLEDPVLPRKLPPIFQGRSAPDLFLLPTYSLVGEQIIDATVSNQKEYEDLILREEATPLNDRFHGLMDHDLWVNAEGKVAYSPRWAIEKAFEHIFAKYLKDAGVSFEAGHYDQAWQQAAVARSVKHQHIDSLVIRAAAEEKLGKQSAHEFTVTIAKDYISEDEFRQLVADKLGSQPLLLPHPAATISGIASVKSKIVFVEFPGHAIPQQEPAVRMIFQPRIFTFYSYKGGVGRSMALLNMAYFLHARGRHVLMVDLDLEAPGVSGYLERKQELKPCSTVKNAPDVVDLLAKVVGAVRGSPPVAGGLPEVPKVNLANFIRSASPDRYASSIHSRPGASRARLDVLMADEKRTYPSRLNDLNLGTLSRVQIEQVSDTLRAVFLKHRFNFSQPWHEKSAPAEPTAYDYILVDSRTGLTEIGGLCLGPLADRLIVLSGLNDQNVEGTRTFLNLIGVKLEARPDNASWDDADPPADDRNHRPPTLGLKPTLLVASPVPKGEITYRTERLREMEAKLGLSPTQLSYHPQMALMETIFVRDHPKEYLTLEYDILGAQILALANDAPAQLKRQISRLTRAGATRDIGRLPGLMARLALLEGTAPQRITEGSKLPATILDEAHQVRVNLAPTKLDAAEALLDWADDLNTEKARKEGDLLIFQSMEDKYARALEEQPNSYDVLNRWGLALMSWGKEKKDEGLTRPLYGNASEKFKLALEFKPDDAEVYYNLARLSSLSADASNTVKYLEKWYRFALHPTSAALEGADFDLVWSRPEFATFCSKLERGDNPKRKVGDRSP